MSDCRISVDVGGASVRVATGDASGAVHGVVVDESGEGVSADRSLEFVSKHILRHDGVEAVSVGFPGSFDASGAVRMAPNLDPSWVGCRVGEELASRTKMPVFVANDARVAALGEWVYGAGRRFSDDGGREHDGELGSCGSGTMIYLGLGTGIGGGVIMNGELHLGRAGTAGELGHVVVEMDGPPCACGSRGCIEAIAGGAALVRNGQAMAGAGRAPVFADLLAGGEPPSVRALARAARRGDDEIDQLLQSAFRALGVLVANLAHALSPDLFVFGGGWSRLGEPMLEAVRAEAERRMHMAPHDSLSLEVSTLEDRAGLLGGLALPDRCPVPPVLPSAVALS